MKYTHHEVIDFINNKNNSFDDLLRFSKNLANSYNEFNKNQMLAIGILIGKKLSEITQNKI